MSKDTEVGKLKLLKKSEIVIVHQNINKTAAIK